MERPEKHLNRPVVAFKDHGNGTATIAIMRDIHNKRTGRRFTFHTINEEGESLDKGATYLYQTRVGVNTLTGQFYARRAFQRLADKNERAARAAIAPAIKIMPRPSRVVIPYPCPAEGVAQ
jgi:hypothetical protein